MRKSLSILVFVSLLAGLCACNKGPSEFSYGKDVREHSVEKDAVLNVHIRSGVASTKTTTASEGDEASVSLIEVLVFNANGGVDAYKSSDGTGLEVSGISSSSGAKTIVAVVNAPAGAGLSTLSDISDLRALQSRFKADNALDKFVMYGEQTFTLVPSAVNDVTVNVDRMASRIRLDKITRHFNDNAPGLQALDAAGFEVTRMYLTNVSDGVNYGYAISPAFGGYWLTDESALQAATPAAVPIDKDGLVFDCAVSTGDVNKLAQDASYVNTHRLYAYPNDGSAQKTKLVVEVKVNGKYYPYPIEFDALEPNYSYEIRNLTVTRLGNPCNGDDTIDLDEDVDPIVTVDYDVELVVNPWTLVLMGPDGDGNITI